MSLRKVVALALLIAAAAAPTAAVALSGNADTSTAESLDCVFFRYYKVAGDDVVCYGPTGTRCAVCQN